MADIRLCIPIECNHPAGDGNGNGSATGEMLACARQAKEPNGDALFFSASGLKAKGINRPLESNEGFRLLW
jgi:hypothetical protein